MYKGKSILGVTLARGGSKSIPKKNIVEIAGKPLISYTFKEVQKLTMLDDYIVSTDDEKIREVCLEYSISVPFLRPLELSGDTSTSADA